MKAIINSIVFASLAACTVAPAQAGVWDWMRDAALIATSSFATMSFYTAIKSDDAKFKADSDKWFDDADPVIDAQKKAAGRPRRKQRAKKYAGISNFYMYLAGASALGVYLLSKKAS